MLIQTLVLIAAMVILSGAVLTSTLVTAKASLHQTVLAKTQTALADASALFTQWAAQQVQQSGTEAWPKLSATTSEPLCAAPAGTTQTGPPCTLLANISWEVRGMSGGSNAAGSGPAASGQSVARNLAPTVDEQRVSATLTVRVTDATGTTVFADRSREVTARIFDAVPYAVITGTRDITAEAGSIHAAQGDTAGAPDFREGRRVLNTPDPSYPANFTGTQITTTVDCINTALNSSAGSQGNPNADIAVWVDHSLRPFGNQDWAFEAPCSPSYPIDTSGAPSDYATPLGNTYITQPPLNTYPWNNGQDSKANFPH